VREIVIAMKHVFPFILGFICAIFVAASSSKITADLTVFSHPEVVLESPQPDGRENKQVIQVFEDLVTSFQYKGQTFLNTNVYVSSNATIKLVPVDPRRAR
jgi:hypothetical protein